MKAKPYYYAIIQFILIGMRVVGLIDWSWWYVMVPSLAALALLVYVWVILMIFKSMNL